MCDIVVVIILDKKRKRYLKVAFLFAFTTYQQVCMFIFLIENYFINLKNQ
jgi:hypothetical protein